jgi:hypothetical protein
LGLPGACGLKRIGASMDMDREWTIFAVEAEYEAVGVARLVAAHNALKRECRGLRRENEKLRNAVCKPCNFNIPCGSCEACARTMAVLDPRECVAIGGENDQDD